MYLFFTRNLYNVPIGSANGGLSFKEEDVKMIKDNSVLQWMERRRRTGGFFMDETNPIFP